MTGPESPTLVSLFAGAGGLDLGLEAAGFRTVAAADYERDCVRTLRESQSAGIENPAASGRRFLDGAAIIEGNVQDLTAAELRPHDADRRWVPDLLAGGPPCQPFSSAGKMRSVADPRGRLFEEFVRLAKALKPRLILFENVRGLVTARGPSGKPGEVILLVKKAFEEIGYGTTFALLNAADFGAPQRRVRCFMMAARHEPLPLFPESTHSEQPQATLLGDRQPWVTLGEFLAEFRRPTEFEIVRPSQALSARLARVPEGSGLKSRGIREATRPGGHWGYTQGTWVADLNQTARTVTAASTQDWVREHDGSLRRLTWRECAAVQGFPEGWRFAGTNASKFRQIGNAVPTFVSSVLGQALHESLTAAPARRRRAISAPFPPHFSAAISYTAGELARNGASREVAKLRAGTTHVVELKGLGSDDPDAEASALAGA